ncbi:zona pellucida protein C [Periophthalmus magnuspinnatus]|uniref:zona pellucida protein C n=1 Tax=Periophthalmus magnuspinnatus TaxID=409849 RepID=UPI002436903A|nr:zona pellucida protein C [Periophthalmus magnuspinnatus]
MKTTNEYVKLSSTKATTSRRTAPRPSVLQDLQSGSAHLQSSDAHLQSDIPALPDVSVTCSKSDFVVRVKSGFYGLDADSTELRLGSTCQSNGVLRPDGDLLFSYPLTQCDGVRELLPGYVVYKFVLHYDPRPEHFPSKPHPITVNIECRYQRNHYLQIPAIKPTWETRVVHKRLRASQTNFHIQLMDDTWTNPVKSRVFQLEETVNVQVSAPHLPPGQKLYINSCYATPVTHSKSNVKCTIIDNYGCLMDSKMEPGASKFVARTDKSVRFSLKAFQFVTDPDAEISMSCQLYVTSAGPSPAHKSCTYTQKRWEALSGDDVICKCCDSQCVTSIRERAMMDGITSSESLWVSSHPDYSSYRINKTGVDKMRDSAEKTRNPEQKQVKSKLKSKQKQVKETAAITETEINSKESSYLEEFKWYTEDPEDEKVQAVESNNMLDVKQVSSTNERLEYQRMKPEAVLKEKAAQSVDPDGSANTESKRVLKQNSDENVRDGKDTTWYFTWR